MTKNHTQLNPFEIKTAIVKLLAKINSQADIAACLPDIELIANQDDKTLLAKILFKELITSESGKIPVICFLLEYFLDQEDFICGLWEVLKNKSLQTDAKVMILNIIREKDSDWSYEDCSDYLEDADKILDENTKQLLSSAVINPEVQIDFMDFLYSVNTDDKLILLNTFENNFDPDALANIYVPVAESNPFSTEGKESIKLLGETKSVFALHALENLDKYTKDDVNKLIKKSLATLKMSGIREDNSAVVYKKLLSNSLPDKFYLTYPDGRGNCAMIFTRKTCEDKIRFVSIVINIDTGIRDCFGFFEISQFECEKILERFLKNEIVVNINAHEFKNILYNAQINTINSFKDEWKLPYEYVCWKNLLIDIESKNKNIKEILEENIEQKEINELFIEQLGNSEITKHWFLDSEYSLEFENLLKGLKDINDLDDYTDKYFDVVFNEEEKLFWSKNILFCAYLKLITGDMDMSSKLYNMTFMQSLFDKFLKNILKRSIYEYLMLIKYNKDLNKYLFTQEDISSKIDYIEKYWVNSDV